MSSKIYVESGDGLDWDSITIFVLICVFNIIGEVGYPVNIAI